MVFLPLHIIINICIILVTIITIIVVIVIRILIFENVPSYKFPFIDLTDVIPQSYYTGTMTYKSTNYSHQP